MGVISTAPIGTRGEVPIAPFREAFARSDLSLKEVARRMGIDQSRVARLLNGRVQYSYRTLKNGERRRSRVRVFRIQYDLAVALARAMDVDPVELGL